MKPPYRFVVVCLLAFIGGCASLYSELDLPKVSIESVKSLPSEGIGPRFQIKLRVMNPNKQDLDIAGISYVIEILDRELVSGVTSDVPLISAYSEEVVTLNAGINMFQFLRLLSVLGKTNTDALNYSFSAKIDFNGFIPTQRVEESGVLDLK